MLLNFSMPIFCKCTCGLLLGCFWIVSIAQGQTERASESGVEYFESRVRAIEERTRSDLRSVDRENWPAKKAQWRQQLTEMLGIPPDLERSPLHTTVVGSIQLDGVTVDRLHYQSRPGLYVGANLYRPRDEIPDAGWPAVLYVCGHARVTDQGRLLGNKTSYQHHGLWLARHGIVCLMIDTVQLGEFHGEHHGTYKLGRWDWIARGYTPAGVEAWNSIRGIDLLCNLPEVNDERIGITGRSGGGAYSWFAAALDERIRVAVPVAGITDLQNHVLDGCVEGHCDCMYFVNYYGWDYAKLAALVAPRALLLENSDSDSIFPLDGIVRIDRQLRQLYTELGAADKYGMVITPGPHKDTQDLRVPAFRWLLKHLKDQSDPLIESPARKEIDAVRLAVFKAEIPQDERVTSVGAWFSPAPAEAQAPAQAWKSAWLPKLIERGTISSPRRTEFQETLGFESTATQASWLREPANDGIALLRVRSASQEKGQDNSDTGRSVVHLVLSDSGIWSPQTEPELSALVQSEAVQSRIHSLPGSSHYFVRWRAADWQHGGLSQGDDSVKKQHQIVRRYYLIGESPEQLALRDFTTAMQWIAESEDSPLELAGTGREALLICLAALTSDEYRLADVKALHIDRYPTDPQLTACLPGLFQVCRARDIWRQVDSALDVRSVELAPLSTRLLVDSAAEPEQANGMRIVEVGQTSAKIWLRATRWPLPNLGDLPEVAFQERDGNRSRGAILPESGVDGLRFAVPGVEAEVRVGFRKKGESSYQFTNWQKVDASSDYSALIPLEELEAGTAYQVRTQVRAVHAPSVSASLNGSFKTLPLPDNQADFTLAVSTCQGFNDRDGPHGFDMYRTILSRNTDAFVMAGDVVYYDALARSKELAYYHWQRTYSLPTLVEFHKRIPAFFLKDDHDTYVNDSWPGDDRKWTDQFDFESGQQIFIQQTGLPTPAYRTIPIGSDLQLWLMEGRDFRSPNTAEDGPSKTIWGSEQKDWLRKTLAKSQAKFKVIISPTPIVGPDRENKRDNHANRAFETEGEEIRKLLASYPNTVSVCGDRHWQFHSLDPETGLHEFSVGPASDRHAGGWKQEDFRPEIHQFLRVAGGYLEIELGGPSDDRQLTLRHLDVHGNEYHRHVLRASEK